MDQHLVQQVSSAAVVLIVAGKTVSDYYRGKGRDRNHRSALSDAFGTLRSAMDQRFDQFGRDIDARFAETKADIAEVKSFCVGPDGQNGFRKDIERLTTSVDGLVDRERDRLAEGRLHGYDRRG